MLGDAIPRVRDGTAGAWEPSQFRTNFPVRPADDIQYARREVRGLRLRHAMVETVAVSPVMDGDAVAGATVFNRAAAPEVLFRTDRPRLGVADDPEKDPKCYPLAPQTEIVRLYADLRADRIGEINLQIDDLLSFFGAIHYFDDQRRMKSLEVLNAAVVLAIHTEMMVKHFCRTPRPIDISPQLQPIVQTPDHSSFPSGHATEAFTIATLIYWLSTGEMPKAGIKAGAQEFRLAHRIATNRTIAGVHYPMDSASGALMGCVLGAHVIHQALNKPSAQGQHFQLVKEATQNKGDFGAEEDFTLEWLGKQLPDVAATVDPNFAVTVLGSAVELAWDEWPRGAPGAP